MKVKVLGCSGGVSAGHYSTCLKIGDNVLLDAGTGAGRLPIEESLQITDIVVSHSHLDHITSLCFIADQNIEHRKKSTKIYALPETIDALRRFIINKVIWPEIEKVIINGVHIIEFEPIVPFQTIEVEGYKITPLPVVHAVPTVGFCLHGDKHEMIFIPDMISASDEVWEWIKSRKKMKYVILEAAFPNRLEEIARISKHMTPNMLVANCERLNDGLEIYATHIKPIYFEEVSKELAEINSRHKIKVLQHDQEFDL